MECSEKGRAMTAGISISGSCSPWIADVCDVDVPAWLYGAVRQKRVMVQR